MAKIYNIYDPEKGYLCYVHGRNVEWTDDINRPINNFKTVSYSYEPIEEFLLECMKTNIEEFRNCKIVYRMARDCEPEIDYRFEPDHLVVHLMMENKLRKMVLADLNLLPVATQESIEPLNSFINQLDTGDLFVRIVIERAKLSSMLLTSFRNSSPDDDKTFVENVHDMLKQYCQQFLVPGVECKTYANLLIVKPKDQMIFKLGFTADHQSLIATYPIRVRIKKSEAM